MSQKQNFKNLILLAGGALLLSNMSFSAQRIFLDDSNTKGLMSISSKLNMLSNNYQLKQVAAVKLPNGKAKYKLVQYYNGIPVFNTSVISDKGLSTFGVVNSNSMIHMSDIASLIKSTDIKGSFYIGLDQDLNNVKPNIDENKAISLAKNKAKIKSNGLLNNDDIQNINSELVIKTYEVNDEHVAKLVYIIDFFVDNIDKPSRPYTVIDAYTGEVLEHWDGLTSRASLNSEEDVVYINTTGPGGNEKTGKYVYGTDFKSLLVRKGPAKKTYNKLAFSQLNSEEPDDNKDPKNPDEPKVEKCYMDSPNVITYDLNNKYSRWGGTVHEFDCVENTFKEINGAYSPINDAHYFGNVVFDMYKEWYDAAPLDFKLALKVHYGRSVENAYWTGSVMLFGDGARRFYPLVSLDVVAHEVSHGFTQQNSNLVYSNMSGGMNESFSDIAGEAAEYFMNMNKPESERNDWLVGETIFKGDSGKALRYFADPTKDNYSIGHVDDYNERRNEVHSSSGIFNRAFYNLATTDGWSLKKAFDAFVLANKVYWTSNSTFDEGGCGVKNAAADLEFSVDDVIAAFDVVGVNATCEKRDEPKDPKDPDNSDGEKLNI